MPPNTVQWGYYIGVDQQGQEAFEEASKAVAKSARPILAAVPGYGPLACLMTTGVSFIATLQSGEDIDYRLVTAENIQLLRSGAQYYYIKKGKVINDKSVVLGNNKSGNYFLHLSNDNAITGVQVKVVITAMCVKEEWGKRQVKRMEVKTRELAYLKV